MEYSDKLLGSLPDSALAELTGKHHSWIHRKRTILNIPSYRELFGCLPRMNYKVDVFDNIDSVSAYWLGFYFADGCVCKTTNNRHIVTICSLDCEVIDKLNAFYEIDNHSYTMRTVNNKKVYYLYLCNKRLFNRMCELGCIPRKSNIVNPPCIDNKFYLPFILGYFDGDGSISKNRAINSWKVAIGTGSKNMLDWIESIVINLNISYTVDIRKNKNNFYSIALCGISGKFFMSQLYSSVPEYLPLSRKKNKFLEMDLNKFRGPNLLEWEKEYIVNNSSDNVCSQLIKVDQRNYGWERSPAAIHKFRKYHNILV